MKCWIERAIVNLPIKIHFLPTINLWMFNRNNILEKKKLPTNMNQSICIININNLVVEHIFLDCYEPFRNDTNIFQRWPLYTSDWDHMVVLLALHKSVRNSNHSKMYGMFLLLECNFLRCVNYFWVSFFFYYCYCYSSLCYSPDVGGSWARHSGSVKRTHGPPSNFLAYPGRQ